MEKCEHEQDELLAAADAVGVKGGDDHEICVLDSSACRDVAHRGAFHGHDAYTISDPVEDMSRYGKARSYGYIPNGAIAD
jgi:hypothetical protein